MKSYSTTQIRPYKNNTPNLEPSVYVDATATVIGRVSLGADVSIWPMVTIRGDVNDIRIGARSNIQDGSVIHVSRSSDVHVDGHPTTIGEDVTVGHKVMLHGCTIGNRVLIGIGTIVLDGAVIEDEVIIGAGTLVTPGKHLQRGYLYIGSPAKRTRALSKKEIDLFVQLAANYVDLKNDYLEGVTANK